MVQTRRKLWCSAVAVLGQGGHARCFERQVLGGAAGAVLAVVDVPVIAATLGSRTVEVPQIQFIARVFRHSSSTQRQVRTMQTVQLSGGYGGDEGVFGVEQVVEKLFAVVKGVDDVLAGL